MRLVVAARTGLGPTSFRSPAGEVVAQVPAGEIGMVTADINEPTQSRASAAGTDPSARQGDNSDRDGLPHLLPRRTER
jgi:hypothetical protein